MPRKAGACTSGPVRIRGAGGRGVTAPGGQHLSPTTLNNSTEHPLTTRGPLSLMQSPLRIEE